MSSPLPELGSTEAASPGAQLLARFDYGASGPCAQARVQCVPLPVLRGVASEVWYTPREVAEWRSGAFCGSDDGRTLFFRYRGAESDAGAIEGLAEQAYRELLVLCEARGYPHLLRLWNYFDEVTAGHGDDQRYRRFCAGRHRALAAPGFEHRLPAATVIGSRRPGLQLFGFAVREAGQQIENPRQTSAFRYPRQYGQHSPSFSRATRHGDALYVSGTAAVVGHETRHPFDTAAQSREMISNLRALLAQAGPGPWSPRALKLYLREPGDAQAAVAPVHAALGADAPLTVLQGDICRSELMVEIEGVFTRA